MLAVVLRFIVVEFIGRDNLAKHWRNFGLLVAQDTCFDLPSILHTLLHNHFVVVGKGCKQRIAQIACHLNFAHADAGTKISRLDKYRQLQSTLNPIIHSFRVLVKFVARHYFPGCQGNSSLSKQHPHDGLVHAHCRSSNSGTHVGNPGQL